MRQGNVGALSSRHRDDFVNALGALLHRCFLFFFPRRITVNRFLRTLLLLFAGCVWGLTAQAQLSTATMFGTVTDSTGAAVPGATVTITQTETHAVRTLKTENDGAYRADFLPVGSYQVSVAAQ